MTTIYKYFESKYFLLFPYRDEKNVSLSKLDGHAVKNRSFRAYKYYVLNVTEV